MNAAVKKLIGHGVEVSVMRASGEELLVKCQLPLDVLTAEDACKQGMCEDCGWDTKSHPQLRFGPNKYTASLCWKWFRKKYCAELKRDDVV